MRGWKRFVWAWILALAALIGWSVLPPAAASPPMYPVPGDPSPAATRSASAATGTEQKIVVDLSEQRVTAYQGGVEVLRFPVSTGRNDNTATGSFRILNKRLAPKHALWGYTMPYWMGVYYVGREWENGFHALPVTGSGRELWGELIGTPASDGCIVLLAEDMRRLFEWASIGTPVEIIE